MSLYPTLRYLVLGWHHDGQRWAVVYLSEDDRWYFHRDIDGLSVPKSHIRVWIDLPSPPRPVCCVSDLDQAIAAGSRP